MNFNIKIKGNDKKEILKIIMIVVLVNILVTIIVAIFAGVAILKTIILYLISIGYVGYVIYIWNKEKGNTVVAKKENFENKYDPILTRFFLKNEFELDESLLNAEIYYLIRKGYVYIDKEKNTLKLKDRNQFKQIDALERINNEKIKEYSTEEIPSYDSMFIGKILFAFHDEIELNELKRNINQNYYHQRGEMCKLPMEKMILFEIEKHHMMGESSNLNFISVACILNIITSFLLFIVMARFNIVLLLATIINIALNVLIIKNENILAYKYSDEIIKYINDLEEYVTTLKGKGPNAMVEEVHINNSSVTTKNLEINQEQNTEENDIEEEKNKDDKQLALLFGIQKDLEFI